ncbi:MAG: YbaK/EbsC family protein [Bacteriovoracaceae bacterium]
MDLHNKLNQLLKSHSISYQSIEHPPGETCELAAQMRGSELKIGGKSLLLKSKRGFHIFTLSAALEADSTRMRKILRSQKLRFAKDDEFYSITGAPKGALPPFGRELQKLDLYLDLSILENDEIAFNAGLLTQSYILSTNDYLKISTPFLCSFSKPK